MRVKESPCRIQTLAGDRWCSVDFCPGCKVFHVKIGYATLHLAPEAFSAVCGILNTALARSQREAEDTAQEQNSEARAVGNLLH